MVDKALFRVNANVASAAIVAMIDLINKNYNEKANEVLEDLVPILIEIEYVVSTANDLIFDNNGES